MKTQGVERKLAAVLSADVAGYSRLMGSDEEATLKTLTEYRTAMGALIAGHGGRIVGTAGDSVLAEFASAIEAVRCGIEIQRDLDGRNAELPDERRMEFRIGINLGDVMIEGDDIYGDGINVAARLEKIAEPGGLCISATVFEHVRDRIPHDFEDDLGEHSVKNITRPVRVYRVPLSEAGSPTATAAGDEGLALPDRPSIAVLPFENMNGDPAEDYFPDGITDDLITALSRRHDLFVIARNSVFTYKGKPVKVQGVGTELGVRYVLEGSVRKAGERVRITAQLVEATSGHHLWAERYDRELEDIFAVQDEITETIVGRLAGKLALAERDRAIKKAPDNLEAYDCYLRGFDRFIRFTQQDRAEVREMMEKAVALDPNYARAQTLLAWGHLSDVFMGWSEDPVQSLGIAFETAQKALAMDATYNWSHWVVGAVLLYQRQHDRSRAAYDRALELNPDDADVLANFSGFLNFVDQSDEAVEAIQRAMRLNPHCPWWYLWMLGWTEQLAGRPEQAIAAIERIGNPIAEVRVVSIVSLMNLGREDEARAEVAEALRLNPGLSVGHFSAMQPYQDPSRMEALAETMRAAGVPE